MVASVRGVSKDYYTTDSVNKIEPNYIYMRPLPCRATNKGADFAMYIVSTAGSARLSSYGCVVGPVRLELTTVRL